MLTLSCIGSAIGVTMAGNTTVAGLKKKPDMFGKAMLLGVLPSTQGLYGFAAFFLMLSSLNGMEEASAVLTMNQGLAMCAAGIALGFVGLWSQRTRRLFPHHDPRRVPRALRHPGICLRVPRSAVDVSA